ASVQPVPLLPLLAPLPTSVINDPPPPDIFTLSLHDALPILRFENLSSPRTRLRFVTQGVLVRQLLGDPTLHGVAAVILDEFHERSEEHTSELQSLTNLVCRLLLEKKNKIRRDDPTRRPHSIH